MENVEYDIQYRANKKYPNCLVKYPDDDIPFNERQSHIRMGYVDGATDQKKIDIDKACEWLKCYTNSKWVYNGKEYEGPMVTAFRKAMEQ